MPSVTHTRTHLTITPANPFLVCAICNRRVEEFHDGRCGCGQTGPLNLPCGHVGDYRDLCPSWGPVDGCLCLEILAHVSHPAAHQLAAS